MCPEWAEGGKIMCSIINNYFGVSVFEIFCDNTSQRKYIIKRNFCKEVTEVFMYTSEIFDRFGCLSKIAHAFIARVDGKPGENKCAEMHTCLIKDEPVPQDKGTEFLSKTEKKLITWALEQFAEDEC